MLDLRKIMLKNATLNTNEFLSNFKTRNMISYAGY